MTGIIYGSSTGNTEHAAELIQKNLKDDAELVSASDITEEHIAKYDTLLLGSSTWGYGDLQDDWIQGLEILKRADLKGKKIGFFGCGDQESFPDTFVDALGIIYDAIKDTGADFISTGRWSTEGYSFNGSRAVHDGDFIGLVLDEENQSELTIPRIADWTAALT